MWLASLATLTSTHCPQHQQLEPVYAAMRWCWISLKCFSLSSFCCSSWTTARWPLESTRPNGLRSKWSPLIDVLCSRALLMRITSSSLNLFADKLR